MEKELSTRLRPLPELETTIRAGLMLEVQGALTVGVALQEAKAQLKHGQWLPWLKTMGLSERTAERRMRLAEAIPEGSPLAALSYSQATALLALPAGEREAFAAENVKEDTTAEEIRKLIAEKKSLVQEVNSRDETIRSLLNAVEESEKKARKAPEIQKVIEVPDDYQDLKMAAARHEREMAEAVQAAEEAEARAAAAEAEAARLRRDADEEDRDTYTDVLNAANAFLLKVQLLPYNRAELSGMYNRQRYMPIVSQIEDWVAEMRSALDGDELATDGEVI
ncbi:MAG: DUF3102 domain-containing protein [Clostridia bacterium]|nr:DUF3102 domain-containing protein [Clostridia bacterium]